MFLQIDNKDRESSSRSESDFLIDLNVCKSAHKGVSQIRFKSMTYSYTFYQINSRNSRFTVEYSNASTKVINILGLLTAGNISVSQMTANIKAQMDVNTSGQVFTVSVNTSTAKLTITASAGAFTITPIDRAGDVLGANAQTSPPSITYESPMGINLTPVRYMYINTNMQSRTGNYDSTSKSLNRVFAKIPITGSYFSNIHYEPSQVDYKHINEIPSMLEINITDSYGDTVNFNGVPFHIEFEIGIGR